MKETTMRIGGKLGNFRMSNDLASDLPDELRYLLDIRSEQLVDLHYETFDEHDPSYPGHDASLRLRVGSAQVVFMEHAYRELILFGSRFAKMHTLFDSARQAAANRAATLQQRTNRYQLDIFVQTPIILFPTGLHGILHSHASDMVTAYLGEFNLSNQFVMEEGMMDSSNGGLQVLNQFLMDLKNIRLVSQFHYDDDSGDGEVDGMVVLEEEQKDGAQDLPIIDHVDVHLDINMAEYTEGSVRPEMEVVGTVSDINIRLTERQYVVLWKLGAIVYNTIFAPSPSDEQDSQSISIASVVPSQPGIVHAPSVNVAASTKTHTRMDVSVYLATAALHLFKGDGYHMSLEASKFCRIALNGTDVRLRMGTDNTMDAEISVVSLQLTDISPDRPGGNQFREILPPADHGSEQFMASMHMNARGQQQWLVSVDSPRVVLVLDHLFALWDYVWAIYADDGPTSAASPNQLTSSQQQEQQEQQEQQQQQQQQTSNNDPWLTYQLQVIHAEIALVASPSNLESEALILSSRKIILSQTDRLSISGEKIGLILCRMDARESTKVNFVDEFGARMTIDSRSGAALPSSPSPNHWSTDVVVSVEDPLVLRVSYRDMMLIADILNRIKELSANALARQIMQQERSKDQEAQGTPGRQPNTVMMPEVPLDRPQRRGVDAGEATRVRLGSSSSQRMSSQLVHESVSLSLSSPHCIGWNVA